MYQNKHKNSVLKIYDNGREDNRLIKSRHGQLEYFTTKTYIDKYAKQSDSILEIGAGTGKYSIELAKEGYNVTAVELVPINVKILKENAKGIKNLKAFEGDALDLSMIKDSSFDIVLVLGPMYHLYSKKDQLRAIEEALRVCKKDGILMFAYLTDGSMVFNSGWNGNMKEVKEEFNSDFSLKQRAKDNFVSFNKENFIKLFNNYRVKPLRFVSADSILQMYENTTNFNMDDQDFEYLKQYHLATCEREDMHGLANHMLFICQKQ